MKHIDNQDLVNDKEYRRKLYEENEAVYKKVRADFTYGVSSAFRQRRKDCKNQLKQLEEETNEAYEEVE